MPVSQARVRATFLWACATAAALFLLHATVLFELSEHLAAWVPAARGFLGHRLAGILLILICFVVLYAAHLAEAAVWAAFLRRRGLVATFAEGVYYTATSLTTVGYGDMVLGAPWRILGPLIAISGVLMFGCSTAFLFLALQATWARLE